MKILHFNPYHPLLIHAKNIKGPNVITVLGAPYRENRFINYKLEESDKNDFNCDISATGLQKSTLTCAVSYSYNLQDTLTISNSKGETYHKSYGYVYSEGDVFSREIGKTLEFARALSKGSSVSISKSDGYSAAIENVHTIVNTNSQSRTNTTDKTHTTTHDESYTLTLSEENSHSRSDGGEVIDETNWSDYSENSSSDEYSRMEAEHYNEAKKNVEGSQVPVNNDKSSPSVNEYATGLY